MNLRKIYFMSHDTELRVKKHKKLREPNGVCSGKDGEQSCCKRMKMRLDENAHGTFILDKNAAEVFFILGIKMLPWDETSNSTINYTLTATPTLILR